MADLKELFEKGEISGSKMSRNVINPVYTCIRMSKHPVQYVRGNKAPYIACIDGVEYRMRLDVNREALRNINNTMCDVFVGEFDDMSGYELVSAIPCIINEHNASKKKTKEENAERKENKEHGTFDGFDMLLEKMQEIVKEGNK